MKRDRAVCPGAVLLALVFLALCTLSSHPSLAQRVGTEPPPAVAGGPDEGSALEQPTDTDRESGEVIPRRRVRGDHVAVGDSIHIPAGTTQDGQVVCIFGDVVIDGRVNDQVVVIGGSLKISGTVRGDVVAVLTATELERDARIGGQLVSIGTLEDRGAEISRGYQHIPMVLPLTRIGKPFAILGSLLLWSRLLGLVLFFVIVLILAVLVPERIRAISDETPARYFAAFFAGLLAYIVLWLAKTLLLVTIIGPPIVYLAFLVLKWLGRVAILHVIGQRIGRAFGREMSLLGASLLGLVPYGLLLIAPLLVGGFVGITLHCLMSIFLWFLLDVPAIGLILLTRAGGRSAVAAVTPPQAAIPPPVTSSAPPEPPPPPTGPPGTPGSPPPAG